MGNYLLGSDTKLLRTKPLHTKLLHTKLLHTHSTYQMTQG